MEREDGSFTAEGPKCSLSFGWFSLESGVLELKWTLSNFQKIHEDSLALCFANHCDTQRKAGPDGMASLCWLGLFGRARCSLFPWSQAGTLLFREWLPHCHFWHVAVDMPGLYEIHTGLVQVSVSAQTQFDRPNDWLTDFVKSVFVLVSNDSIINWLQRIDDVWFLSLVLLSRLNLTCVTCYWGLRVCLHFVGPVCLPRQLAWLGGRLQWNKWWLRRTRQTPLSRLFLPVLLHWHSSRHMLLDACVWKEVSSLIFD